MSNIDVIINGTDNPDSPAPSPSDTIRGMGALAAHMTDRDYVLSHVRRRVTNYRRTIYDAERNGYVHRKVYDDLLVMYHVQLGESTDSRGKSIALSILREDTMRQLGLTIEDLDDAAEKNEVVQVIRLTEMFDLVSKLTGEHLMPPVEEGEVPQTMLLSSTDNPLEALEYTAYCAYSILHLDALKRIADLFESDLVILPSSVHEILLEPFQADALDPDMKKRFIDIVLDVNAWQVEPSEQLSDHPYMYLRETDEIVSITDD